MDRFLEEVVVKQKRMVDELLYFGSWALMILCAVLGFFSLQMVFYSFGLGTIIPTVVLLGIAVYLWFNHDKFRTEYEYTFTNGQMDFAQVFNNKKRKNLGTMNIRNVEAMGLVASGSFNRYLNMKDVKRSNWFVNRDAKLYYFYFVKNEVRHAIILELSDEMITMIKPYLPFGVWQG